MLLGIGRFVFLSLTDVATLPALVVMKRNRRHFEMFVGVSQLLISFFFNTAEAFDTQLFLGEDDWHFLSDVVSVTYFLLLCVHLMGYKDENRNIVLRYVAFAGSLLFNTKDRWDSTFYEEMLVVCYLLGVVYRRVFTVSNDISPLNRKHVVYALCSLAAAAVAAIGSLDLEDKESHVALGVTKGLMHVLDCKK
uniref:Uncharacterized protein n=2 Tax=Peronospora matthiolae TaxID=2874970 RepID=A0AAV1UUA7_9STRA